MAQESRKDQIDRVIAEIDITIENLEAVEEHCDGLGHLRGSYRLMKQIEDLKTERKYWSEQLAGLENVGK